MDRNKKNLFWACLLLCCMGLLVSIYSFSNTHRSNVVRTDIRSYYPKNIDKKPGSFSTKLKSTRPLPKKNSTDPKQRLEMRRYLAKISPHYNTNQSICTKNWIVATDDSKNIIDIAKRLTNWCIVIVVKDRQSTDSIEKNIFYLTMNIHAELAKRSTFFEITHQTYDEHYTTRKNAGYLWAILHQATAIWDYHVDNEMILANSTHLLFNENVYALTVPNHQHIVFNPYPFFLNNSQGISPRGFPVAHSKNSYKTIPANQTLPGYWPVKNIGVIQSLIDNHPDVDILSQSAIQNNLVHFKTLSKNPEKDVKLIVPRRTFAPYNDQATLHLQSALWALLLPMSIAPQISDIWRSFVMQRLMWDVGLQVAFAGPYVSKPQYLPSEELQSMKDAYLKLDQMIEFLANWSSNQTNLVQHAEQLYADLYSQGYIEITDVQLMQVWLNELHQYDYIFPNVSTKLALVVRTFSGHLGRMNRWYFPTLNMFIDRSIIDVMFVLDDESPNDHTLGDCLKANNFTVKYEGVPEFSKKINFPGYDRQQWSTFYMDQYSNSDYIGVIDADGMIYSFMHPFYSIFASDDDPRIMLKPMAGDHYIHDKDALKFNLDLDFMWPNRMPMWYRWETYQNLRNYISLVWNVSNFDHAYAEFFKNQGYSQFTILSSYAMIYEPSYYRVIMNTDPRGAVTVASNRGRDADIRIGCCRSFRVGCNDSSKPEENQDHILRFDNCDFVAVNATEKTNYYYKQVHAYLKHMSPKMLSHMKESCERFLQNKATPVCAR